MKTTRATILALLGCLLLASLPARLAAQDQTPAPSDPQEAIRRHIEQYLRYAFAWGPNIKVTVGSLHESVLPGLYTVLVQASKGERGTQEVFLASPDGHYLVRGDFIDTTEDPFAAAREIIIIADQPTKGPADAPVTIVEYGDFQCPDCAAAYPILKKLLAERRDVRLVFKDLPLTRLETRQPENRALHIPATNRTPHLSIIRFLQTLDHVQHVLDPHHHTPPPHQAALAGEGSR